MQRSLQPVAYLEGGHCAMPSSVEEHKYKKSETDSK